MLILQDMEMFTNMEICCSLSHCENKFYSLDLFHSLPSGISVGRSNIKQVADKRRADIEKFLVSLFKMAPEISQSDLVYTFFHPLLRDQKNPDIRLRKVKGIYDSKYIIIIIIIIYEYYVLNYPANLFIKHSNIYTLEIINLKLNKN